MSTLTITIPEAAERLGWPKATTERAARDLGLLIMAGNRKRINPNDLPEIIDKCRSEPKDRAFISAKTPGFGSSATPGAATAQQALESAARLKKPLPNISQSETAQPAPIRQKA